MSSRLRFWRGLGIALILAGLIANSWVLARTLSPDGVFDAHTKRWIYSAQVLAIGPGFVLLYLGARSMTPGILAGRIVKRWPNAVSVLFGVALDIAPRSSD